MRDVFLMKKVIEPGLCKFNFSRNLTFQNIVNQNLFALKNNRRQFLKLSAVAATGLVLPLYSCGNNSNTAEQQQDTLGIPEEQALAKGTPISTFGIQLYTLKEAMAEDPKNVLQKLSSYGYKQVEGFEGQKGLFWGMGHKEFNKYIEDLGMEFVSSHANIFENFEEKAQKAGEIGMEYLICPWVGPQESIEDFKKIADTFNKAGAICKKNNLRFAYHNHAYSFEMLEGQMPQKVLMEYTDPELVDYEMDIYWVVMAGENPQEHLMQYSDRYNLVHVKDRRKDAAKEDTHASTILGTGSIDYVPILKTAKETGVDYYFVEQEAFAGTEPFESSQKSAEYLKNLEI